ncbi:hypothetical protein FRZ44_04960 [Hypericibacter terrae]|uniref:Uncharacterized protein n=1 Tax=Hypericibacter terrae TaxID=2602015 RepID=A0A5J6MKF8_9PROT|nr:hypothetical protein FRZ44_04960 [Hypericibacter terrae]
MQSAQKPEHEKDNQHQAEYAAQPGSAITAVPIIPAATAEQHDQYDNDEDCTHVSPLLADPPEALGQSDR